MSNSIDTKIVSKLAEILDKNKLTELEYEGENFRICLTRDCPAPVYAQQAPMMVPSMNTPVAAPVSATEVPVLAGSIDYSTHVGAVKSPMVGVVYLSSAPSVADYVKVGDSVKEGDTVCLIEAMKTFNPVKATKSGTIKNILVASGDPVEYGEPLVIVE